ncbi:response regulator transcription factor [Dietzia sp. Die43]|uniref:response regulator transcription factor n=1 Tax=Dietzia sp. Die43 TaxID=2926011 RepID=UPI002118FF9A|nr:response regulator transcription factor [Dietzia sp. Die43]
MPIRVTVVNDHPVVVAGVNAFLAPYSDRVEVVATDTVSSGSAPVDVALYDSFAAQLGRRTALESLLREPTVSSVAVYSFTSHPGAVSDSLEAGAHGFLSKSLTAAELVGGLEQIAAGDRVILRGAGLPVLRADRWPAKQAGLSPRESEVVGLIVQGLSNEEIAERCYLSPNTVKTYVRSAYRKMGVTSRAQAVAWGMENGLGPAR